MLDELLRLIKTSLRLNERIDPDTPLISSGLIDSFDIVTLLAVFENEYGVVIESEEIDVHTFDTPALIFAQINRRRG